MKFKQSIQSKSWIGANQLQASSSVPYDEEVIIKTMDTTTIEDMDSIGAQKSWPD